MGGPDEPGDAELLRRYVAGDVASFAALVHRHGDRLWALALRTLGDATEAEDAVQDALVAAMRAAAGFRGEAAVTTWLHRICVNCCVDRLRRRARRPAVPLDEASPPAQPDPTGASDVALDVAAALSLLPDEQRLAVVLVDVEGWAVADVAATLGVPIGTVKSRCARGRVRLAGLLGHLRPDRNVARVPAVQGAEEVVPDAR